MISRAGKLAILVRAVIALALISSLVNFRLLPTAHADELNESDKAAREALGRAGNYPWYDKASDDVRVLSMEPEESRSAREPSRTSGSSNASGLGIFQLLAWLAIGLVLAVLVYLLIRAYLDRENSTAQPQRSHNAPSMAVDRVESLPFQVQRAQDDLLGEARRLYDQGNFREAIVYLFSFELLQLDRHGVIRLAKGKTNRQYVREASREKRPLALLLEQTMEAFESAFFGHHDLPREQFESCWHRVSEFERLAAEGT